MSGNCYISFQVRQLLHCCLEYRWEQRFRLWGFHHRVSIRNWPSLRSTAIVVRVAPPPDFP